ncbi:hypothetical protein Tco_0728856 [Tanacetum coccineum]|uniref:Uncharacterized protein n=1 Tax=Tanacetum coccineum TaxID=301880 RepID=A0ABQ4YMR9_9ASTR
MVKREVEIETLGECVDEIDKLAELIGEMQLKQEDRSCVHASNELHLHVFHVVAAALVLVLFNDVPCIKSLISPQILLPHDVDSHGHRFHDLWQVVVLFALAWMDFHKLILTGDLWSIDVQIDDIGRMMCVLLLRIIRGRRRLWDTEFPVVKNSSYNELDKRSNSCSDGAVVFAEGETFRTSIELEGSLLWS